VLSGEVKISMTSSEGKEIVLAILHPGEVFARLPCSMASHAAPTPRP
jgi:CRP-like cAMP-binding protein